MEVNVYNMAGEVVGRTALSDAVFGVAMNPTLVHQVVVSQQANARVGSADTKRRGEVAGGGKKPWRQKGTGRARQGSTRAPHWRGGGVVFGPHPRSYAQAVPRKMRRLALKCVLSSKVQEGRLVVLESLALAEPKTRAAVDLLRHLNVDRTALIVTPGVDENVVRAARNLPTAAALSTDQLNVIELLRHDYLVLPVAAVRQIEQRLGAEEAEEVPSTAPATVEPSEAAEASEPAATTARRRTRRSSAASASTAEDEQK